MAEETGQTLEEQIDDMLGEVPEAKVEEEEEEIVEDDLNPVEEEEEGVEDEIEEDEPDVEDEEVEEEEDADVEGSMEEGESEDDEEDVEEEEPPEPSEDVVALREKLNQLSEAALRSGVKLPKELLGVESAATPPVTPEVVPQAAIPPTAPLPAASYDEFQILMEGVNFDDFMDNEENFVNGMRNILANHEQMVSQRFMQSIPQIVQNQVNQTATLQRASDEFYRKNGDLKVVKPTVGAVATQISEEHPDWSLEKIMDESARVARELLKMPEPKKASKRGKKRTDKRGTKPSFARTKGSKARTKTKPKTSKMQQQIDDMLED